MNKVKLRLDYFLSLGLKLVEDDVVTGYDGGVYKCCSRNIHKFNNNGNYKRSITSFTPRKNTGVQPVGDGVPVVCLYESNIKPLSSNAGEPFLNWNDLHEAFLIKSWKPNLKELIKMQIEHDKKLTGEDTVKKLTSDQIKWEDGMNWAVVCKKDNNAIRDQYAGTFTKRINKYNDVLICFGSYRYSAEHFYLIKRKDNKKIVDAVNFFKARITCLHPIVVGSKWWGRINHGEEIAFDGRVVCTEHEYYQCIDDLTGCPKEHLAWLTALNDMRAEEEKEREIIDTMANQMAINLINNTEKTDEFEYDIDFVKLSSLETPEQKPDLEREEMAKKLYEIHLQSSAEYFKSKFFGDWSSIGEKGRDIYLSMVDAGVTIKG